VLLAAPPALRAAPAVDPKPKAEFPAEKVRKALDQTVEVNFDNIPFKVAFDDLKEKTKINFVLDVVTLANNGIAVDSTPVSVKLSDVKAKHALRAMLDANRLGYAIVGDTVFISTEDEAQRKQLKQKVSLDLDKVALETAVKDLGRETGVQLVIDKKASKEAGTQVTVQLEDVPLDTAIRLICDQAGLKPVRMGNVLYVTTSANAKELRAEPELTPNPAQNGWNGIWKQLLPYIDPKDLVVPIGR
jgi:type II secretory pathway component GspD/PulD (secretin)